MALLMVSAPLSGCVLSSDDDLGAKDLSLDVESLEGGVFQTLDLKAGSSMSVFVPYLVIDPANSFVQNSTIPQLLGSYV